MDYTATCGELVFWASSLCVPLPHALCRCLSSAAVLPEGQAVAIRQHPLGPGVWSLYWCCAGKVTTSNVYLSFTFSDLLYLLSVKNLICMSVLKLMKETDCKTNTLLSSFLECSFVQKFLFNKNTFCVHIQQQCWRQDSRDALQCLNMFTHNVDILLNRR